MFWQYLPYFLLVFKAFRFILNAPCSKLKTAVLELYPVMAGACMPAIRTNKCANEQEEYITKYKQAKSCSKHG